MSETIITTLMESMSAIVVAIIGAVGVLKFKKDKSQKLKYHPVFSKIDFDKDLVKTFEFKNKGKELVFKEILDKHLDFYNEELKDFVDTIDNDANDMDSNELCNRAKTVISDIRDDIIAFYKNDRNYTDDEKAALKIVLNKYNNWNFDRDKNMMDMIEHVCGSTFYATTYTKAVTILDLFLFSIAETIEDANKTLNSLNGDLKGLKFKGVEI